MADLLIKQPNEILEDLLRTLKAGLEDAGVSDPQVGPGTDYYILATAIANEISLAMHNVIIQADALLPDTATGADLDRLLATFGLARRAASKGRGFVELVSTQTTLVVTGAQLISGYGLLYQVVTGGNYANGSTIEIESVDSGSQVNLEAGEILSWVNTPAFGNPKAEVSTAVSGAVDAETDEVARARLLARLQNPPALCNWQQVAELVEALDPSVQKAFVYPAAMGPSTMHVAITGYPTDTSVSRALSDTKMNELRSAVQGSLPEYVETTVTTVQETVCDVSFSLAIPYPEGAVNYGTGGGWLDFSPFPLTDGTYTKATVSVATSSTSFTVTAPLSAPPTAGITQIQWIDRSDYTVKTATVLTTSGTGPYTLTIDTPFTGIAVGDYIFPACTNAQTYVDAVVSQFAAMGPGEVTSEAGLLPRAKRKPLPHLSWAMKVGPEMLKALLNAGTEVLDASFYYRTSSADPTVPSDPSDGPNIFIPRHIGFYPAAT
jgi:uncharacterized phage protein gp47/JayE